MANAVMPARLAGGLGGVEASYIFSKKADDISK
jgi:hypothetical protein